MFEDALKVSPQFVSKPIGAYRLDDRYIKNVDIKLSAPNKISNNLENLLYRFNNNNKDELFKFIDESIQNSMNLLG